MQGEKCHGQVMIVKSDGNNLGWKERRFGLRSGMSVHTLVLRK